MSRDRISQVRLQGDQPFVVGDPIFAPIFRLGGIGMMDRHTPLAESQKAMGAKFVSFGGWELPVSYTDILKEHHAVRTHAGLFDVSHMGEILVTGEDAIPFVNGLITNDLVPVPVNKAVYSPMCYENGTTVDDIIVYKISADRLFLVVNAGNTAKDEDWIKSHASGNVNVENVSDQYVQLAVQGPEAQEIIRGLVAGGTELPGFFCFKETELLGMKVLLSRTGYTGEDGFELYLNLTDTGVDPVKLWEGLMEAGKEKGLTPVGLGARDTLRLEAALPLYGHELSDSITPLEAGLFRFIKLKKEVFIGKEALEKQSLEGLKRKLFGFVMEERAIPRNGYEVYAGERKIGSVTSGSPLPSAGSNGGLFLSEDVSLKPGDRVGIDIRDRIYDAKIVETPFFEKRYSRK